MEGGYVNLHINAHVWGELKVEFLPTANCLEISARTGEYRKVELLSLFLSGESDDAIEQLGVIIDGCQDAINHLRSKKLGSEVLGTAPDSAKVNDAVEAAQLGEDS